MPSYNYPEHYADDFRSALQLADELQLSGEYDLFRGQRHTFDIQPSILRDGADKEVAANKLNEFAGWVHNIPDLHSLHDDPESILAVAQHYGIATPLLDFSYSSRIAGFFATDGGIEGDTGTIICLNKKRFIDSWDDINRKHREQEGFVLTQILEIDVTNLWRLAAQQGVFLRCHVGPDFLEMFSFFLHIYFPQQGGIQVLDRNEVYPREKSHLEVLLDQYFLIDSYPERERQMEEFFGQVITVPEDSMTRDIASHFKGNKLPSHDASWQTEYAQSWLSEPAERLPKEKRQIEVSLALPEFNCPCTLEDHLMHNVTSVLDDAQKNGSAYVNWTIVTEKGLYPLYVDGEGSISKERDEYTWFSVSEMVNVIYAGMRNLPYTNHQVSRSIARYLAMLSFGVYEVIGDAFGIETSGAHVRGRGYCNRTNIRKAIRDDFLDLLKPEILPPEGEIELRDLVYLARFVKSSYVFDRFVDLFVEDVIPSQANIAVERLVIGLNPMKIEVLGES